MSNVLVQKDPTLEHKKRLAEMLMNNSSSAPVTHWTQGLNNALSKGLGAYFGKKYSDQEADANQTQRDQLAQVLSSSGDVPSIIPGMAEINPNLATQLKLGEMNRVTSLNDEKDMLRYKMSITPGMTPEAKKLQELKIKDLEAAARTKDLKADELQKKKESAEDTAKQLLSTAREVYADDDGLSRFSGLTGRMLTVDPTQKSFEAKIGQVISSLTLGNTDAISGALSDKDIEMLEKVGQAITEGGDFNENKKQVAKIINKLETSLGLPPTDFSGKAGTSGGGSGGGRSASAKRNFDGWSVSE